MAALTPPLLICKVIFDGHISRSRDDKDHCVFGGRGAIANGVPKEYDIPEKVSIKKNFAIIKEFLILPWSSSFDFCSKTFSKLFTFILNIYF